MRTHLPLFRLLLVCLLSLSVPLQGWATLAMSLPVAHADAQGPLVTQADMPTCHGSTLQHEEGAEQAKTVSPHPSPAKAKTSCGACCGAMLDTLALPAIPSAPTHGTYHAGLLPDPAGHIPGGLERPPKRLS